VIRRLFDYGLIVKHSLCAVSLNVVNFKRKLTIIYILHLISRVLLKFWTSCGISLAKTQYIAIAFSPKATIFDRFPAFLLNTISCVADCPKSSLSINHQNSASPAVFALLCSLRCRHWSQSSAAMAVRILPASVMIAAAETRSL
jgi:hypothetical protein